MTQQQTETATFILSFLHQHGGLANLTSFGTPYLQKYGYERENELYTVLRILTDDEQLIAQEPNDFYRLTKKGTEMAQKGYGKYEEKKKWRERFSTIKDVTAFAASVWTLIGGIIGWLANEILRMFQE